MLPIMGSASIKKIIGEKQIGIIQISKEEIETIRLIQVKSNLTIID